MNFAEEVRAVLLRYDKSSPVGKMQLLITLRTMFNTATIPDAISAIDSISDDHHLRVLLGVGMKGVLYYKLAARRGDLLGL